MSSLASPSSDLAKGKNFLKRLLYVQHVDKEKDTASETSERYLEEYLIADRTNFLTKYLKSPKANLIILKRSMGDFIREVAVYSNPLPIPLKVPGVTFHAFVVFRTDSRQSTVHWWSLEKNGTYIVLQQSENKDDVINKIYDTETKTIVERLGPIKKQKRSSAQGGYVRDLMRIIVNTNMLNERYNLVSANCQNFASFVFGELSIKRWSTVTSAIVDRLKKKKIEPINKVNAFKYQSILKDENFDFNVNDDKFDCYWAMMEGRRKDFEELINDLTIECLNDVDSQGYTLLEWATVFSRSDWPIDEELKIRGAKIRSDEESFRRNVFFIALQYLPPNQKSKYLSFDRIDINGVNGTKDTALHLALNGEKWEIAEEILNRFENYDVNITNSLGDTPLLLAARLKCEIDLFTKILNQTNSENVNKTDENGNTALHYAIININKSKINHKYEIATKELLARSDVNVDIKNKDHESALLLASTEWKDFDLFKLILEKSTDINSQDKDGDTAFHWAIRRKSEIAIKIKALLAHSDVDVNVQNNKNETALHLASHYYWKDIPSDLFKIIVENSTNVNAQDKYGYTALHWAIFQKSEIATKELLAHSDVDVKVKNNYNVTSLHLASYWEDIPMDLFKQILEKSIDINAQDHKGWTALHWAIRRKSEIATKELLSHKDVDVNVKDNNNQTALQFATRTWKNIPSDLFNLISERKANKVKKISKMDRLFKYLRNLTVSLSSSLSN